MAFGNVYTFGPTFRAEKSYTQRHAAEFWMIEPEMAFADLAGRHGQLAEAMIKYVIQYVHGQLPAGDGVLQSALWTRACWSGSSMWRTAILAASPTPRRWRFCRRHNDKFEYPVYWGCDLQTEHERYLTEQVFKKPVFVTDYPKEIKAFYMRQNDDGKTVAAADMPGARHRRDHRRQPA